MNILDFMSFDTTWFTQLPGILITVGIVLLLISLILLLTQGKEKKNTVATASTETASVEPVVNPEVPTVPVVEPAVQTPVEVQPAPVVEPVVQTPVEVQPAPVVEPAAQTPVEVPTVPIGVNTTAPEVQIFEAAPAPVETVVNAEVKPEVETPNISIYGGSNPSTDIYVAPKEEVKPVIYGGANPLENTASLPKMETYDIYSAPKEEVKVVEPSVSVEPVSQTAVVNNGDASTISAAPTAPVETPVTPAQQVPEIEELDL